MQQLVWQFLIDWNIASELGASSVRKHGKTRKTIDKLLTHLSLIATIRSCQPGLSADQWALAVLRAWPTVGELRAMHLYACNYVVKHCANKSHVAFES